MSANNAINAGSKKRGDEGAPLFTAGYGERGEAAHRFLLSRWPRRSRAAFSP